MGERGPAKGHGGRPRKKNHKPRDDGYVRMTVGPKSNGEVVYEHRAKAYGGMPPKVGKKGTVVHHKDHNRSHNSKSNLEVVSRKTNRAKSR
jgi:hypothetical protein